MFMLKKALILLFAALILILGACSNDKEESKKRTDNKEHTEKMEDMDHGEMSHSSSGETPKGLKTADHPTYKVGSEAILETDHMEGMKGAKATIAGAYETTAYVVSYTPNTGGKRVENHKWVIQEEMKDAGSKTLTPGTEVTLVADHMKGMKGASAEIESAEKTTVYMVDYTSTTNGEEVKNHKWVTENELSPVK
ncbi:YdhK family protein [Pseudobacillus sp. FSL P4-0506]|uniref:YdhK family protein n=2 Tax=Pseudobacillus TaxID=108525 RepID=UPI0030FBC34E